MLLDSIRDAQRVNTTAPVPQRAPAPAELPAWDDVATTGLPAIAKDGFDSSAAVTPAKGGQALRGTPPPDPSDPTRGMTRDEEAAYERLPSSERAEFDALHRVAAGGAKPLANQIPNLSVQNLRDLAKAGEFGDYLAVSGALGSAPQQERLRDMVFGGQTKDLDERFGSYASLLSELRPLAKGGTSPQGVDRIHLLKQIVNDVARPDKMVQGKDNLDCAGTAAAYVFARENPAAYAKSVIELAEKGSIDLADGRQLGLVTGGDKAARLTLEHFDNSDKRSVTQQIFAKTFVESAGAERKSLSDVMSSQLEGGLNAKQLEQELGLLKGKPYSSLYVAQGNEGTAIDRMETHAEARKVLDEHAKAGKLSMANLDGTHWVVVTGTDKAGAGDRVNFVDGSGKQQSMDAQDFLSRVDSMVFDPTVSHPRNLGQEKWGHHGGGGNSKGTLSGGNDWY